MSSVLWDFFSGEGLGGGQNRCSVCSLGYPGIHSVDRLALNSEPSASVSWVLGLKVCAVTPGFPATFRAEAVTIPHMHCPCALTEQSPG